MSVYLDANALVALFIPDPLNARAARLIQSQSEPLLLSDYAALEVFAVLMRSVRAGILSAKDARDAAADFDAWTGSACGRVETDATDIKVAQGLVRRDNLSLRATDAIHVAIVQRLGARLLTFDKKLASNAKRLGLAIV